MIPNDVAKASKFEEGSNSPIKVNILKLNKYYDVIGRALIA